MRLLQTNIDRCVGIPAPAMPNSRIDKLPAAQLDLCGLKANMHSHAGMSI